jgi:hypothetical protein
VPHIAVPFRSRRRSVRAPCRGRRCPHCRGVRAPGVRQAASGVQASGQPVSVGRVGSGPLTSADAQPQAARRYRGAGTAAAGPRQSCRSRTLMAVAGWLRNRTLRTPGLSAASGTAVAVRRSVSGRLVSGRLVSAADTAAACGCPPLQELVARPAAAGRVPPPPVRLDELGAEAVAEPGAHVGHGRPLQG